jgi:hypothetical protein
MEDLYMEKLLRRKNLPYLLSTMVLGTLNHFLYEYSGENPVVALFAPVNESVWEHLKLLFFPFLLLSVIEYYQRRPDGTSFFGARFAGVWAGMLSIIGLYYGYSGSIGRNFTVIDILIYFISVLIAYLVSARRLRYFRQRSPLTVFLWWIATLLLFFFFTCFPPELPLFLSPV